MPPRYRSKFEKDIAADLTRRGVRADYERVKLSYTVDRIYTPDWRLENGIIVESKGRLTSADRAKMLRIKASYPDLDIRFLFQNPCNYLSKTSRTTYGAWASKHGFPWASGTRIPDNWLGPQ